MAQNSLRLVEDNSLDKNKALDAALSQIERAFGKGSIMRLGENEKIVEIETVSTGSLGLDIALGIGGLPKGRVVEVYGPESSDAEHALDPVYARKLGVDLENLLISQPDTGEQALEITDTLVRSGAIDVLVVDSVAALTPRAEIEGEMGDSLPRSVSTSAASARSRTATRSPATRPRSRWSRTSWRRRSSRSSSTSCMARASPRPANWSIWA